LQLTHERRFHHDCEASVSPALPALPALSRLDKAGRRYDNVPVRELVTSIRGPSFVNSTAEIEAVSMWIFWKESNGVPMKKATAALMVSAWLKAAIIPLGWRCAIVETASTTRSCISLKLSPSGNRKVDCDSWTSFHSCHLLISLSFLPFDAPKSHSLRATA